jgi:hypothetical protein
MFLFFILFQGFWLELKLVTTLITVTLIADIFIVPVVVDIGTMSTVAGKCYMKMSTLIQRIIVP